MKFNPLPPISCGTNSKLNKGSALKQDIERISKPIFEKALKSLKEINKTPMVVGDVGSKKVDFCYYEPHNYRLYIDFSRVNFDDSQFIKPWVGNKRGLGCVSSGLFLMNKTECFAKGFHGCDIRVKKNQIEILNLINSKHNYIIKLDGDESIKSRFAEIIKFKDDECFNVLKLFIIKFGGSSKFNILNVHSENKITHEDFIDDIPLKEKFHNKIVKKVYNDSNVEFSTPAGACNYLVNQSLKDFSPVIEDRLTEIKDLLTYQNLPKPTSLVVCRYSENDFFEMFKNDPLLAVDLAFIDLGVSL